MGNAITQKMTPATPSKPLTKIGSKSGCILKNFSSRIIPRAPKNAPIKDIKNPKYSP